MKYPGSATVHYVDHSGHCHTAFVVGWHERDGNPTYDLTYFSGPGAINSARGVPQDQGADGKHHHLHSWHTDCPND